MGRPITSSFIGIVAKQRSVELDKADIALWASVVSAAFSAFSGLYARKMAKNDSERMERRKLVLEIVVTPSTDFFGWYSVDATVRNLEPVAATLKGVRVKNRRLKLLPQDAGMEGNSPSSAKKREKLPEHEAAQFIDLERSIQPFGSLPSETSGGGIVYFWFYVSGNGSTKDFELIWEWADGQKQP